ncbi:hypothetical protein BY996DRAFT_6607474, partial [Phakopsora pachyrhizi]
IPLKIKNHPGEKLSRSLQVSYQLNYQYLSLDRLHLIIPEALINFGDTPTNSHQKASSTPEINLPYCCHMKQPEQGLGIQQDHEKR